MLWERHLRCMSNSQECAQARVQLCSVSSGLDNSCVSKMYMPAPIQPPCSPGRPASPNVGSAPFRPNSYPSTWSDLAAGLDQLSPIDLTEESNRDDFRTAPTSFHLPRLMLTLMLSWQKCRPNKSSGGYSHVILSWQKEPHGRPHICRQHHQSPQAVPGMYCRDLTRRCL